MNRAGEERLGITHKGIGVVEHYLMARRLMARNIYHSQKKLALEALLVRLLAHLAETIEYHPAMRYSPNRLGQFLMADNRLIKRLKIPLTQKLNKNLLKKIMQIIKNSVITMCSPSSNNFAELMVADPMLQGKLLSACKIASCQKLFD